MDVEAILKRDLAPHPRRMIAEYALIFSGSWLKFQLIGFGVLAVQLLILFYGPPPLDPSISWFPKLFAVANLLLLCLLSAPLMLFIWTVPLLGWFIFPIVISVLEIAVLLLLLLQGLIAEAIITPLQNLSVLRKKPIP